VDPHTFTKQAIKVGTNVVCQKAYGNCFLGQELSVDGGIHATRDHNNIRSILQNIKKTAYGHGNADIWCSAHS
jgi:hypothetical protein